MQTYTVFCTEYERPGSTTWIDHAWSLGRAQCAEAWYLDDPSDVHVLGIAEGEVNIVRWHD